MLDVKSGDVVIHNFDGSVRESLVIVSNENMFSFLDEKGFYRIRSKDCIVKVTKTNLPFHAFTKKYIREVLKNK